MEVLALYGSEPGNHLLSDNSILLAAVEASSEAILITSADLGHPGPRIEYANPAFARMTGYHAGEVLGRTPHFLQGPETDRKELDRLRRALLAGQRFHGEATNYHKDGSTYTVEWLISPVRDGTGLITHWISAQRDVTGRRASEKRQQLLVRELHHRVRNTLATVQAVLNVSLRSSASIEEFGRSFAGRLSALATTHALITEEHAQAVSFEGLLRAELDAFNDSGRARVSFRGPRALLNSELAVPVGMALHEMTANAVRHGALGHADGRLDVIWSVQGHARDRRLRWTWTEHGGPPVSPPTREGFGMSLLRQLLDYQAQARVDIAFDPGGLRITVDMPLPSANWALVGEPDG